MHFFMIDWFWFYAVSAISQPFNGVLLFMLMTKKNTIGTIILQLRTFYVMLMSCSLDSSTFNSLRLLENGKMSLWSSKCLVPKSSSLGFDSNNDKDILILTHGNIGLIEKFIVQWNDTKQIQNIQSKFEYVSSYIFQITEAIIRYFLENHQTDKAYKQKLQLRDVMFKIFQSCMPSKWNIIHVHF